VQLTHPIKLGDNIDLLLRVSGDEHNRLAGPGRCGRPGPRLPSCAGHLRCNPLSGEGEKSSLLSLALSSASASESLNEGGVPGRLLEAMRAPPERTKAANVRNVSIGIRLVFGNTTA
jgi:hypothetical protein